MREQDRESDPARVMAELAAQTIEENFLPGIKPAARAAALLAMTGQLRDWPDSKPETCWIVARGAAPGLVEWVKQPWTIRQAIGAFAGVLVTMDRAFRPEPKPKAQQEAAPTRMKPALVPAGSGLKPVFKR